MHMIKGSKIINFFLIIFSFIFISGCVTSFHAVGYYEEYNEVFVGEVSANLLSGTGKFIINGKITGLVCEGASTINYIPNKLSCVGQRGEIFGTCSDGRNFRGDYVVTSCSTGYGRGIDEMNNIFRFKFGLSEQEAAIEIEKLLKSSKMKPDLPKFTSISKDNENEKSTKIKGGTGFFFEKNGWILTSYHILKGTREITVFTHDGKSHKGFLISKDPNNDIAVIKIEDNYPFLNLGSSNTVKKGADVMTLGYPLIEIQGYEIKATFGKINALSGFENDIRFFQIDVPVQPGNSGGPLFDSKGNVIGIISARLDPLQTARTVGTIPQNVNYAVKIDYALPLLSAAGISVTSNKNEKETEFKKFIPIAEKSIVFILAK